jgi:hypothetical protein
MEPRGRRNQGHGLSAVGMLRSPMRRMSSHGTKRASRAGALQAAHGGAEVVLAPGPPGSTSNHTGRPPSPAARAHRCTCCSPSPAGWDPGSRRGTPSLAGCAAHRPAKVMAMVSAGRRGKASASCWAAGAIRAPQMTARWSERASNLRPARSSVTCPVRSISGYSAAMAKRSAQPGRSYKAVGALRRDGVTRSATKP